MSIYRPKNIQPRNGHTLVALDVGRISGCEFQKEISLDDQHEHAEEVVAEVHDGERVEYRSIATKGKGEDITRPELAEVEAELRSREIDLMVIEDTGRLVRGVEAVRLIGIAVDCGTRVIAPNDCIDTADESWEEDVISACRDHVGHNAHTSKRIKKKLMLRFKRKGQAARPPIAGYATPEEAKSYHDMYIVEESRPLIRKGAADLLKHGNCTAIADYFNSVSFPVGSQCRNKEWDGKMVRRFFKNPILKGMPERGNMYSEKQHATGKRISKKNPEGPVSIEMPHLEILPPLEFDELNAVLDSKNKNRGRKPNSKGRDPLEGVQRKRTRFPGQHAQCWYCGRQLVWGGNGIKENLQCKGSRSWECWNSVGFNGTRFAKHVVDAIHSMLSEISGFDQQFRSIVEKTAIVPDASILVEHNKLEADEAQLAREFKNFNDAIREFGTSPELKVEIEKLKQRKQTLLIRRGCLERKSVAPSDLPGSASDLAELLRTTFLDLAIDSYELGALLPKIVPSVFLYLVRMVDGGPCLPRVKFTIDLSGAFESAAPEELQTFLVRKFTVDMFEIPKRARIRKEVMRLKGLGLKPKQIIESLGEPLSTKMIQNAVRFDVLMQEVGAEDPLRLQLEPPNDYVKFRRHKNPRYSFSMKEGYVQAEL